MKKRLNIGLALGSGGARGLAHIGVLKVFKQEGIEFDVITGTSFGALVGAMYAINPDPNELEKRITDFILSQLFKRFRLDLIKLDYLEEKQAGIVSNVRDFLKLGYFLGIPYRTKSYTTTQKLAELTDILINNINIEETKIKFAAIATDVVRAEEMVLDRGNIRQAIRASCAIPGIFPPAEYADRLLVDGGWAEKIPVDIAIQLGADFVIAVNVSRKITEKAGFMNGLDILIRANDITSLILTRTQLKHADIIIKPEVGHFHWTEFTRFKEIIDLGMEAATENIQLIKNAIAQKRKFSLTKIFKRTTHNK